MAGGLQLRPITGALGVEVHGVSLASPTQSDIARLRGLVDAYSVVIFPGQDLDAEHHMALARRLGHPQIHAYHAADGPNPELLIMRSSHALADFWHSDETYEDQPPDLSVLRVVECPSIGGDTLWVNQYLTFESLSPVLQDAVSQLRAVHVTPDGDKSAEHPVVYTHPTSGRRALYVNRQFTRRITNLNERESDAFLSLLYAMADNPDNQCRYHWSVGSVAVWDNRTTLHRVAADYHDVRHTERAAVVTHPRTANISNG
jgi:taurine dioxygenase